MARSKSSYVAKAFGSKGVFSTAIPERSSGGVVTKTASTSGAPAVQATAPTSPREGDLWYNTTTGILFLYASNVWVISSKDMSVPMSIALS